MTYILLVAGKGTRLHPLTLTYPKCLFKLDENVTTISRIVNQINKYDGNAEIVLVTGFMDDTIRSIVGDSVIYVHNPFYSLTNSIASLWFARDYLNREQVTIINGDMVMSDDAVKDVICKKSDRPVILLDSSIKSAGDYNVEVDEDLVVVMSKNLSNYYGEYAGITILDEKAGRDMIIVLEDMMQEELFGEWYEDVVVRMIFRNNYNFFYADICNYEWTEIDSVDDLRKAKRIHSRNAGMLCSGLRDMT